MMIVMMRMMEVMVLLVFVKLVSQKFEFDQDEQVA